MKITNIKPIGRNPVYDISVADVEHYILENGVASHNTGGIYSANQIFIIKKAQEKDGSELAGYKFTINIEKSRYVREKAKFPFIAKFDEGINKWSGLLEIALESGFVTKPKMGWYSRVDMETGEVEDKKFRAKDTNNKDFWKPILSSDKFHEYLKDRYQIAGNKTMTDDDVETLEEYNERDENID